MPRETFQQELDELRDGVIDLGSEVERSLESMVRAMEGRDAHLAQKELGVDVRYKGRGAEIERECMILQARQAPVARDLRLLYTVQSVTNHLVRSGTLTEHICHAIVETAECERNEDLEATLLEMPATRSGGCGPR
jgi:phosphate transport system protein